MKKMLFMLAFATFAGAAMLTGCKSPSEKVEDANENLEKAQRDLEEARRDSAEAEKEWGDYRSSTQQAIDANKERIVELRAKKRGKGTIMDPTYEEQIVKLEDRNRSLEVRLHDYENYHSDWSTFKREFNHDMEELGKSFKDLTKDNER